MVKVSSGEAEAAADAVGKVISTDPLTACVLLLLQWCQFAEVATHTQTHTLWTIVRELR